MNAEFSYHMGGALYIPQKRAPSPEPVTSSAVTLPEAVPSSAAAAETATELSTANTPDPYDSEWQAPDKEGEPNESEWDTSDVEKDPSAPGDGNTHNLPQSSASRTKTKYQQECWNEMYESLETFHETNGHVEVPYNSSDVQVKKLYRWLGNQRMRYRAMVDQRPVANVRPMTSDEYDKLNTLGVDLVRNRTKIQWDEMHESLEAFRQTNGHVKVPSNSSDVQVKKLYIWLGHQRTRYKAMVDPRSTVCGHGFNGRPMTSEEYEKLTALGVDLAAAPRTKIQWDEMYESLEAFHQRYGHVRVPWNSSDVKLKKLYSWLGDQRKRYKAMVDPGSVDVQGYKGRPMTSEEVEKLTALGVDLAVAPKTKTPMNFSPSLSDRSLRRPKRTYPKGATPAPSAKRMRQDDRGVDLASVSEEVSNNMSRRVVDDEWFRGCTLWKKSRRSEPLTQQEQRELQLWKGEQRQDYFKFPRGDPSARLDKDGFEFLTMLGFDLNIEVEEEHGDQVEQEAQKEEEKTGNVATSDKDSHPRLNTRTSGFSREATLNGSSDDTQNDPDAYANYWSSRNALRGLGHNIRYH